MGFIVKKGRISCTANHLAWLVFPPDLFPPQRVPCAKFSVQSTELFYLPFSWTPGNIPHQCNLPRLHWQSFRGQTNADPKHSLTDLLLHIHSWGVQKKKKISLLNTKSRGNRIFLKQKFCVLQSHLTAFGNTCNAWKTIMSEILAVSKCIIPTSITFMTFFLGGLQGI